MEARINTATKHIHAFYKENAGDFDIGEARIKVVRNRYVRKPPQQNCVEREHTKYDKIHSTHQNP